MTLELPFGEAGAREAGAGEPGAGAGTRGGPGAIEPRGASETHGPGAVAALPVSVVIITYNSSAYIRDCLRSLREAACVREVLVVDNASTDGSAELVARDFPEVRLLTNEKNVGYARGVNRGLRESREPFVLVLNPDVRVHPGAIESLWRRMEADPSIGIVGPKLLNPDGTLQHSCRRFYTLGTFIARRTFLRRVLPLGGIERRHLMVDEDHDAAMTVDWLIGAAMLVRREAADEVGPMDERFFLYFEDVDWCYRMSKRGWRVLYLPEAVMVHHHRRESARRPLGRTLRTHIASSLRFYEKWSGILYLFKRNRAKMAGLSLLVADLIALNAAFALAWAARGSVASILEKPVFPLSAYGEYLLLLDVVSIVSLYVFGLYRRGRLGDWADRFVEVGKALLAANVVVMALTFLSYRKTYSRAMLLAFAAFAPVLVALARGALARLYEAAVSQRFDRRRILVLGPERAIAEARARFLQRPEPGYEPMFVVLGATAATRRPATFLAFLQDERVSDVLLLWSGEWPAGWAAAAPGWMRAGISVRIVPEFVTLLGGAMRIEEIAGHPALKLDRGARPGLLGPGKKANDVLLAAILLVVLAPFACAHLLGRRIRGLPSAVERFRASAPDGTVIVRRRGSAPSPALAAYPGLPSVLAGRVALIGVAPLPPDVVANLPVSLRHLHAEARPGLLGAWEWRRDRGPAEQRWADLEYVLGWTLARDWKILVRSLAAARVARAPAAPIAPEAS